ncbi:pentatricopeptide repeat-containing protein At1g33350-like [Dioscorea cayenensis subsp. rotundata]|uniref:Pentatricopeptide repeat-containing protein At1g33350-like n=1 Tax=Dioscorea cayennensis subsp. rotundata TaxID=55577 RepID=A0AB40CFZ3_DIOCR|nr:pentatricopeptide repeat-containing protein At1g33350-like [Dioscorea cayenensis subsp. rotundata]XP_039137686.1 pentatricopeptide repeat-containing protein At1g33350-like [Dioscorea cayenensis subsp. rotundata]XP_039137687.1 pentatricopeptide repeat-containing protein At1g33350-like [Dioscorea cayenensis subsp. rotundata]
MAAGSPDEQVLSLLSKSSHLRHLKQIHGYLIAVGHAHTQFFAFKLVRFAAIALSDLAYARLIFDSLPSPNVYLYTGMITAYSSCPDPSSALHLFRLMLSRPRPRPNHFVYPHVLKSCFYSSHLDFMKSVHSHILKSGFQDHGVVQTSLLDGYARFSDVGTARQLFDSLRERNVVSWTAMVSGYLRVGMVGNAVALFEEMPARDVPSWNAVIAGCTQNGLFSEAVGIFRKMLASFVVPNQTTVACVLSACGQLSMLRFGKWVHGYITKNDIEQCPYVSNSLIDMYGKCGSLREARWIFSTLSEKNLTTWNSMINCLALHGHSESAIAMFKEMECEGCEPDEVTFVGLLNACTHGGLVDEGLDYFESMSRDFRIEPQIEHYGCVIDLLVRAGRFEDAMGIVRDMRIEPDEVVWGSLLNGCRIYGDAKLAELAVRKLLELDPENADYGVMLANLYSENGKWEEVRKVRKLLKEGGGKKLPGCSWIEIDSEVHQFYSGDKFHPRFKDIYMVLEGLFGLVEL